MVLLAIENQERIKKFESALGTALPFQNVLKIRLPGLLFQLSATNIIRKLKSSSADYIEKHGWIPNLIGILVLILCSMGLYLLRENLREINPAWAAVVDAILRGIYWFAGFGCALFFWLHERIGAWIILLDPIIDLLGMLPLVISSAITFILFLYLLEGILWVLCLIVYVLAAILNVLLIPLSATVRTVKKALGLSYHIKAIGLLMAIAGLIIAFVTGN
jgi:hypothetical protein